MWLETKIEEARVGERRGMGDEQTGESGVAIQLYSRQAVVVVVGVSSQAWLKSISSNSYMHRNGDGL